MKIEATPVTKRHRSEAAVAADVADAVSALRIQDDLGAIRLHLSAIIRRAHALSDQGVPISVAAELLSVSEPTVRSWIKRGVLHVSPTSRPILVEPVSLGEALSTVEFLRTKGEDKRLLKRALEELDDRRTRDSLADRLDEMHSGKVVRVHPDDVESLFE